MSRKRVYLYKQTIIHKNSIKGGLACGGFLFASSNELTHNTDLWLKSAKTLNLPLKTPYKNIILVDSDSPVMLKTSTAPSVPIENNQLIFGGQKQERLNLSVCYPYAEASFKKHSPYYINHVSFGVTMRKKLLGGT